MGLRQERHVSNDREDRPRDSIEDLLCEVLHWSQGDGEYGAYCKLCKGASMWSMRTIAGASYPIDDHFAASA
jgi:hypothetical protein